MKYVIICILIAFSAFFSGSEIAFSSVGQYKLDKRASESKKLSAKLASKIGSRFNDFLITVLIGNNIVNIFTSSISTVIAVELMGDSGAFVATAIITVIILTFGEIMPKIVASRKALGFTGFASLPLYILYYVTFPLTKFFGFCLDLVAKIWQKADAVDDETITEDDLETMFDTAEEEGVVDEKTADLLQGALDFGDVKAVEIIVPRVDMIALDIDDPAEENKEKLLSSPYTRIPVYKDTIDNIVGILNTKNILLDLAEGKELNIESNMTEPLFVHGSMKIDNVLENMRKTKKHIAIVTDDYGGVDGILTMEDILEQIVGEIWDERDVCEPEFERIGDNLYRANGDMRAFDLFDEFDIDYSEFEDDSALTLGGFAMSILNDYADVGDTFKFKNLTFKITEAEEHRILSVEISEDKADDTEEKNDLQ